MAPKIEELDTLENQLLSGDLEIKIGTFLGLDNHRQNHDRHGAWLDRSADMSIFISSH